MGRSIDRERVDLGDCAADVRSDHRNALGDGAHRGDVRQLPQCGVHGGGDATMMYGAVTLELLQQPTLDAAQASSQLILPGARQVQVQQPW